MIILQPFFIKLDSTIDVATGDRLASSMVAQVMMTKAKSPTNLGEYHPEPEFGTLLYTLRGTTQPDQMVESEGKGFISDGFRKWLPGFSQQSTVQKVGSEIIFTINWSYKTFTGESTYSAKAGLYNAN